MRASRILSHNNLGIKSVLQLLVMRYEKNLREIIGNIP